jgi:hypothetical protein
MLVTLCSTGDFAVGEGESNATQAIAIALAMVIDRTKILSVCRSVTIMIGFAFQFQGAALHRGEARNGRVPFFEATRVPKHTDWHFRPIGIDPLRRHANPTKTRCK